MSDEIRARIQQLEDEVKELRIQRDAYRLLAQIQSENISDLCDLLESLVITEHEEGKRWD
jgi:hypothetical protein